MFDDSDASNRTCIDIPSDWKREKQLKSNSSQTKENKNKDQESQVAFYKDQQIQTEVKKKSSSAEVKNPLQDPKFYKFISRAVPMLEVELDAALRSRAFDGYALLDSELESEVRKVHTLDPTLTRTQNEGLRVSSITWSSVGSTIGVTFEVEEHEDWCDHPSALHIWNLNRRDFDPGSAYKVLQAPTCLTTTKFHPQEPGLITAGGHSGEIFVWNAYDASTDTLIAQSGVASIHKDKISTIQWISASHIDSKHQYNDFFILTTSLDGIIILWDVDLSMGVFKPMRKMLVDPRYLQKTGLVLKRKTDVGITCLSKNMLDESTIIFGTESGGIFEASLTNANPIHVHEDEEWHDPIKVPFVGHHGKVNAIEFSPFERNIFLSCGSDQEIRIYSLLHPYAPVHVIPIEDTSAASLAWSWSRPLVFAAGCYNHKLLIYDLRAAKNMSQATTLALELKASEKLIPFPLTTVEFGASKTNGLLATGDGFGRVHVWKLTPKYMSRNPDENKILADLGIMYD